MQCCNCPAPMLQLVGRSRQWLWGKARMSTEVLLPVCVRSGLLWAVVQRESFTELLCNLAVYGSVGLGVKQSTGFKPKASSYSLSIILLHIIHSQLPKATPNIAAHPLPLDKVGNPDNLFQKWVYNQPDEAFTQAVWPSSSLLWEHVAPAVHVLRVSLGELFIWILFIFPSNKGIWGVCLRFLQWHQVM